MNDQNKVDIFGISQFGEAAKIGVQGFVDGTGAFLSRICLPAAEEIGLYFKDHVRQWRKANAENVLKKAEAKLAMHDSASNLQVHPRMASKILEEASWIDDPFVQDAWAGLLASSCTEDGQDDSNLVFVNLLAELTSAQVRLLDLACRESLKDLSLPDGFTHCLPLEITVSRLVATVQVNDINTLDFQLDSLRSNGLLEQGGFLLDQFKRNTENASIQPTTLALNLFIRGQGSRLPPGEYFGLTRENPPIHSRKVLE